MIGALVMFLSLPKVMVIRNHDEAFSNVLSTRDIHCLCIAACNEGVVKKETVCA